MALSPPLPWDKESSAGGTRSSQPELFYLGIYFMFPLSDYGSCRARAGPSPIRPWAPTSGDYLSHFIWGLPKERGIYSSYSQDLPVGSIKPLEPTPLPA